MNIDDQGRFVNHIALWAKLDNEVGSITGKRYISSRGTQTTPLNYPIFTDKAI